MKSQNRNKTICSDKKNNISENHKIRQKATKTGLQVQSGWTSFLKVPLKFWFAGTCCVNEALWSLDVPVWPGREKNPLSRFQIADVAQPQRLCSSALWLVTPASTCSNWWTTKRSTPGTAAAAKQVSRAHTGALPSGFFPLSRDPCHHLKINK